MAFGTTQKHWFQSHWDRLEAWAAGLVDPHARAGGPPPRKLGPFFRWAITGSDKAIGFASLANLAGGVTEVAMVAVLGMIVDAAVAGIGSGFFAAHWGLLLGGAVLVLVLRPLAFAMAGMLQSIGVGANLFNLTLSRLHRHTLGQSVGFFDSDFAGRIAQKQMQTARAITDVVMETVNALVFAGSTVLATAVLVGDLGLPLLLVLMIWLGLYMLLLRYFLPRLRQLSVRRAAARAMVTGQVVDTVTNIKTVKLFALSSHEDEAAIGAMGSFRLRAIDHARVSVVFRAALVFVAGMLPVAMVGTGLWLWSQGALSAGALTTVGALAIRLSQMTGWISWTLMTIYGDLGEIEDGMTTLAPPHALTDQSGASVLNVPRGEIQFDAVSFGYGRDSGGIQDISLRIAPGEKLGVVGASGAGKSTLVAALLRLYDIEAGRILIDGQNVAEVTQESLRSAIGMVTQETAMFNRSARDNVLYGRPDAPEAEMITAARRAEAHEFITQLVDHEGRRGYDAFLGERGVKLSGGQRQRIALARALLKDAPILVLDEATSALDSEVEAQIQSALAAAMQGKTVIAIAHRLSTLADMDRIIVLDQGHIVESGTHEALIAEDGLYARFWNRQSGGFISTDAGPTGPEPDTEGGSPDQGPGA